MRSMAEKFTQWLQSLSYRDALGFLFVFTVLATLARSPFLVLVVGASYIALWCWRVTQAGQTPPDEAKRLFHALLEVPEDKPQGFFSDFFAPRRVMTALALSMYDFLLGVAVVVKRESMLVDGYVSMPLSREFSIGQIIESAGGQLRWFFICGLVSSVLLCFLWAALRQTFLREQHEGFRRLAIGLALLLLIKGALGAEPGAYLCWGALYAAVGLICLAIARWVFHGFVLSKESGTGT